MQESSDSSSALPRFTLDFELRTGLPRATRHCRHTHSRTLAALTFWQSGTQVRMNSCYSKYSQAVIAPRLALVNGTLVLERLEHCLYAVGRVASVNTLALEDPVQKLPHCRAIGRRLAQQLEHYVGGAVR